MKLPRHLILIATLNIFALLSCGCATAIVSNGGIWSDAGTRKPKPEELAAAVAFDTITLPVQAAALTPALVVAPLKLAEGGDAENIRYGHTPLDDLIQSHDHLTEGERYAIYERLRHGDPLSCDSYKKLLLYYDYKDEDKDAWLVEHLLKLRHLDPETFEAFVKKYKGTRFAQQIADNPYANLKTYQDILESGTREAYGGLVVSQKAPDKIKRDALEQLAEYKDYRSRRIVAQSPLLTKELKERISQPRATKHR